MPAALTPVDYDPFAPKPAAKAAAGPTLTPVDHDPFAAAAPKPAAKPAPKPRYNPVTEFRENLARRSGEAASGFMEGSRQFAPGDGQAADPLNAVGGLAKMAGSGWSYAVSPLSALADTAIGKPVETLTGTSKTFAGDAADQASGFVAGRPHAPEPRTPRMTKEAVEAERAARTAEATAPKLTPVEHDPFKAAEPKLTPVEHDPFAANPKADNTNSKPPKMIEGANELEHDGVADQFSTRLPAKPTKPKAMRGKPPIIGADNESFADPLARTREAAAENEARFETLEAERGPGGGPVVGTEADPIERVDNAMYRLGGHATADKAEMSELLFGKRNWLKLGKREGGLLDQIPKAHREELYHAIEQQLIDPNAPIPEHLQGAWEKIKPLVDEQRERVNRLRERNDPDIEPFLEGSGHVPRRVQGYTPMLDDPNTPGTRDPILGRGRSLVSRAQAQKGRTAGFMATNADGETFFVRGKPAETDIKGRPWAHVRQATTKEIEAHTDLRYHKDAVVNFADDVIRLRQVERNLQVLDELKQGLKGENLAYQHKWWAKNDRGELVEHTQLDPETGAHAKPPEGMVELPHIPQLKGWYFDKRVADVLKDYKPDPNNQNEFLETLNKVNRALTASLFITPIPHAANVMAHWAVGRGWDWMPQNAARLMRTGTQAAREVLTLGPKYRQMLREGSALMYGDTQTRNFQKLLMQKAGMEVDDKAAMTFAKAAGLPVTMTAAAIKAAYAKANQSLWAIGDIFMLQRQLELEAKGMSPRKAIKEAERDIPNYRIPDQVMGSRAAAQALKNPSLMMFGRYKYGQFKAWGEMFKDLAGKGEPGAQKEAVGKFLVAMIAANVAYPIMDAAVQKATGNQNARVKRAGPFSLTDSAYQAMGGPKVDIKDGQIELTPQQKEWSQVLGSFISIAPAIEKGVELKSNRDYFGRPIMTPQGGPDLNAAEGAMFAGENAAYPFQLLSEGLKGNPAGAAGKLFGLELPTDKQVADRKKYGARDKRAGAKATRRFRQRVESGAVIDAMEKLGKK